MTPYLRALEDFKKGSTSQENKLNKIATAADYISLGDTSNTFIRKIGNWSKLPNTGFLSTICPAMYNEGYVPMPKFCEWFGKNSPRRKIKREIRELKAAIRLKLYASDAVTYNEYAPMLYRIILDSIKKENRKVYIYIYIYIYRKEGRKE